ncbi:tumor necrosis factor receptor superfamily member 14 isoform X2 [Sphaerodactylus townsendi]|uniref:tumor necrosis factor receptor superfamily member 14 isoform X2 n=1 Tax=Sphaerodactylus townsendi TaxID=933632 RepID=UPI0020276419|nr:tumor necrosis factor receptor superfamily member 14 isoform X2 [Sphaerodactylus townsendi]
MGWIFTSIIFATLLFCSNACREEEYEINGECCPKCGPGSRVFKHCTSSSSTSCISCIKGTYTEHPHGLTYCLSCQICDSGSNLMIKRRCTYTENAVCSCAPGYYCTHFAGEDCDSCQEHTVAQPGYMVTQPGTETTDTQYVPCPAGTFSTEEMSPSCKPWTNCTKSGETEEKAGNATSDAICRKTPPNGDNNSHNLTMPIVIVASLVVLPLLVLFGFFCWRRKRKTEKPNAARQEEVPEYQCVPVAETNLMTPIQETTQISSKPAFQCG